MMGYKDRSWCMESLITPDKRCTNYLCDRNLTPSEKILAIKWWGDESFPIVFTEMRTNECGYKHD